MDNKIESEISSLLLDFMAEGKNPSKVTVPKTKDGLFKYKFI